MEYKQGTEKELRYWLSSYLTEEEIEDYVLAMVDAETWLSAPFGFLQDEYDRIFSIIECPDNGILNYLKYCEGERLRAMSPSLNGDWDSMTGFNLISEELAKTHFYTIDELGNIFYFIFDEEREPNSKVIKDISNYIIWDNDYRGKLEHMDFEPVKSSKKKYTPTEVASSVFAMDAYNVAVRYISEHTDEEISSLVGQYYYGKSVRKELEDALSARGIEFKRC